MSVKMWYLKHMESTPIALIYGGADEHGLINEEGDKFSTTVSFHSFVVVQYDCKFP